MLSKGESKFATLFWSLSLSLQREKQNTIQITTSSNLMVIIDILGKVGPLKLKKIIKNLKFEKSLGVQRVIKRGPIRT